MVPKNANIGRQAKSTHCALKEEEVTLAEVFKSRGYDTAYMGKWHLGSDEESQPQNQGFDEWRFGFFGTTEATLYGESMARTKAPEKWQALIPQIIEADHAGGPVKPIRAYDLDYRRFIDRDIARAATSYIKSHAQSEAPFFLFLGWTRPHYPNDAAPDYHGKSRIGSYGDSVMELDGRTGEVLAAISEAGIENDTIVIFDRVRENLRKFKKMPLADLLDLSVNDTLSRTILTSVTTLVALLSLYVFGGQVIRGFTFAMIWGVIVGTYSSVFVASPLLLMLGVKREWSGSGGPKVKQPAV